MPQLEIDEGGEVIGPALHDARLIGIEVDEDTGLRLRFKKEDGAILRLTVPPEEKALLWGGGIVVPGIVSAAWLAVRTPPIAWLAERVGREHAPRMLKDRSSYARDGWLLAIEMNYGGPVAIFGRASERAPEMWFELETERPG